MNKSSSRNVNTNSLLRLSIQIRHYCALRGYASYTQWLSTSCHTILRFLNPPTHLCGLLWVNLSLPQSIHFHLPLRITGGCCNCNLYASTIFCASMNCFSVIILLFFKFATDSNRQNVIRNNSHPYTHCQVHPDYRAYGLM